MKVFLKRHIKPSSSAVIGPSNSHGLRRVGIVAALLLAAVALCGCHKESVAVPRSPAAPAALPTKKDDSTSCAYWKCSKTKKLYMQKYVKQENGSYKPAGAFKLDTGIGAFPLDELDKYGSDGESVPLENGSNNCPYCQNRGLKRCDCGKTSCEEENACRGTCPWCGESNSLTPGTWGVGGGG